MSCLLKTDHLSYRYHIKGNENVIFNDLNVTFEEGKFYAITGKSGSGKSTLLSLLGGLLIPDSGKVLYDGVDIENFGRSKYRKKIVSIIFQNYNLLEYLNAFDNIALALEIGGKDYDVTLLKSFLSRFGIDEKKAKRKVRTLSGGEQQRIAIARAVAMDAKIILADEPTGNLDEENAREIIEIFKELVNNFDKTVIMVTHDKELARQTDRILYVDEIKKTVDFYE